VGEGGGGEALDLGVVVLVEGQQLLEAGVLGQHDLLLACKIPHDVQQRSVSLRVSPSTQSALLGRWLERAR